MSTKVRLVNDPRRLDQIHGVPLAEQAREALRTAILDGSIRPGERITIEQLAAELGVSRTPVREALKALEQDGLVHLIPHRGAVVEPVAREELHRRYTIRAMLEGYAAELACKADAAGIADALEANCDELEALAAAAKPEDSAATRRLSQLNQEFHAVIRDGAGSRTLVRLLASLRNPVAYTNAHWSDPHRRRASIVIHREIASAFRQGQPDLTRSLMERHILEARDALMASSDQALAEPPAQR
jgi:DNA-binding GntR family transcriptional regulator